MRLPRAGGHPAQQRQLGHHGPRQIRQVGHGRGARVDAHEERVAVALHRDVERDPVDHRPERVDGPQLHAREVERAVRPGHVGDHQIARAQLAEHARAHTELDHRLGHRRGHCLGQQGGHRAVADGTLLPLTRATGRGHGPEALERRLPVVRERHEHGGQVIAEHGLVLPGSHRHRHDGDQRALDILIVRGQVRAQSARADGEHDVVDRRAEPCLELPDLRHVQLGKRDGSSGAHRRLEGVGCPQRDRHRTESLVRRAAGQPHHGAADFVRRTQSPDRAPDEAGERVAHQPCRRREARRDPGRRGLGHRTPLGSQVEQLGQHLRAGHAVDDGVVHLGDQPDHPVCHALNDVHLPRRLLRRERAAHHIGDRGPELGVPPGRGQRDPVQMIGQVEFGIIHPARVIQSEGDGHEPAPERLKTRNPRLEDAPHPFEAVAPVEGRWIEHAGVGDLHRRLRRVGVDEHRVDAGHSLHRHFSTLSGLQGLGLQGFRA